MRHQVQVEVLPREPLFAPVAEEPALYVAVVLVVFLVVERAEQGRARLEVEDGLLVVDVVVARAEARRGEPQALHDGPDVGGAARVEQDVVVGELSHAELGVAVLEDRPP